MQMAPRGYGQSGEKVGLLTSNTFILYNLLVACGRGHLHSEVLKAPPQLKILGCYKNNMFPGVILVCFCITTTPWVSILKTSPLPG